MKRILCIILIAFCSWSLFAWGPAKYVTSSEDGHMVEDLFEDGFYKNRNEIASIVPVLTPQDITLLYGKQEAKAWKVTLKNGLLGFGSGSFGIGDKKGGWIQLGCELGGTVVTITSFGYLLGYGAVSFVNALFGQSDEKVSTMVGASAIGMIVGLGSFIGGRIYGIVRGITYPKQFNKDLKTTLYGISDSTPQLSFAPVVSPTGIGFGVGVKF